MDSEYEICMWELTALHYLTAMLSSMSQDNDKLGHFLKHNMKLCVPLLHLISFFFSLPIWDLGVRSYYKE